MSREKITIKLPLFDPLMFETPCNVPVGCPVCISWNLGCPTKTEKKLYFNSIEECKNGNMFI